MFNINNVFISKEVFDMRVYILYPMKGFVAKRPPVNYLRSFSGHFRLFSDDFFKIDFYLFYLVYLHLFNSFYLHLF